MIKCNDLDLNLFQFDYDLTFAAFFLNHDKTIYARYGVRNQMDNADDDVSIAGLAATMEKVLALHQAYPANKVALSGKQPSPLAYRVPQEIPTLSDFEPRLNYAGNVVKSCIHCHQVRDAIRLEYRVNKEPIPSNILFPYPSVQSIGLSMDVDKTATIKSVEKRSIADVVGLKPRDDLRAINKQQICSPADIAWILHNAKNGDSLEFEIKRGGQTITSVLKLPDDWREKTDIAWRPTSWDLRRMSTGGLRFEPLGAAQKKEMKIDEDGMALLISHVGQYGKHAQAKRAGLRKNDVLIEYAGRKDLQTESQLMGHAMQQMKPGQVAKFKVLRNGKELTFQFPLQGK